MKIFMTIMEIVAFSIIMLIAYNLLKKYLLVKINVKHKWILIVLGFACILAQSFLKLNTYSIGAIALSGLSVIFLLWYMDVRGFLRGADTQETSGNIKYVSPYDNKKNKKNDVIRPKAKAKANKAMKKDKED